MGLTPRVAYVIHFALVMSLAALTGVFWLLRDVVNVEISTIAFRILRYAAVAELVVAGVLVSRIRSAVTLQTPGSDLDAWWSANGSRVVVTWALAHASGITAGVFWLISGDTLILAAIVVASLLILLRLGPGHWRTDEPHRSSLVP